MPRRRALLILAWLVLPRALAAEEGAAAPAGVEEPAPLTAEERAALEEALAPDDDAAPAAPTSNPLEGAFSTWQATSDALASMNPNISVILDAGGAWFSDDDVVQTGGHDPIETGFFFQQLEMTIGASVDPLLRFDGNLVFAESGVEVEEAYATTLALPFSLQARAGAFLTRFGRLNPTHPHSWSFVDQPLVNGKLFGAEGSRGVGLEVSWLAPLPWYVELIGSANDATRECCARSFLGGSGLPVTTPADVVYTTALRQFFPFGDDWSLNLGFTAQTGPNPTGPWNRTEIYGADLYLRWRPVVDPGRQSLSLTVEAMHRRRQIPRAVLADTGFYTQLIWQFAEQWELGARLEAVSGVDDDPLDPEWSGTRSRATVVGDFYPSHFSRLRLQAAYGAPGVGDDVIAQLSSEPVWSVFAALEVLIGAHGAHSF